jgi:hypothetical protein
MDPSIAIFGLGVGQFTSTRLDISILFCAHIDIDVCIWSLSAKDLPSKSLSVN